MRFLGAALLLAAGIGAGLYLARYLPPPAPALPARPAAPAARAAVTADAAAPSAVVLRAYGDGEVHNTAAALALARRDIVIARVADFAGAGRAEIVTATGAVTAVRAVVAFDERYGIAALATTDPLPVRLPADSADGGLYLGREVTVLGPAGATRAAVASAVERDELGAYRYRLRAERPVARTAAAVLDPDDGSLLGMVIAGDATQAVTAIDREPLDGLVGLIGQQPQRTLREFARHYFSATTRGRLQTLERLVASNQFANAIALGRDILYLDAYTQRHANAPLRAAFAGAAQRATADGRWRDALGLLDEADRLVGLDDSLLLLRADAHEAVGELGLALEDLVATDQGNDQRIRSMVIENALRAGRTGEQSSLELLRRAIGDDPDYAPYHRLLGDSLARRGDVDGAVAALRRAVELDPAMAGEVDPLLRRLRARRDTPPLTEVPIQRRRGTIFVNARINGSTQTFRFLVDTGASYTAITAETALRLGINEIFFGAPVVELQTANGRVFTTTATLGSIDVSGARVNDVEAVILESMSGLDGLLGQSFLHHFDVNIDRSRGVIAFNRRIDLD